MNKNSAIFKEECILVWNREKNKAKYGTAEQAWDAHEKSKNQAVTWYNLVKGKWLEYTYSENTTEFCKFWIIAQL